MDKYLNRLRQKMANKEVITAFSTSNPDPMVAEMLAMTGVDFVWCDAEHPANDYHDMQNMIIGTRAGGAAAILRMRSSNPVDLKPLLDMGADGIIFPMINTAEDARKAVEACSYPPYGVRGFGPQRAGDWGLISSAEYAQSRNKVDSGLVKIMTIETQEACRNIEEICQVEGVDMLDLGPGDLSMDMGIPGQEADPRVRDMLFEAAEVCKKYNKPILVFPGEDKELMKKWMSYGVSVTFVLGFDMSYLATRVRDHVGIVEEAKKEFFNK